MQIKSVKKNKKRSEINHPLNLWLKTIFQIWFISVYAAMIKIIPRINKITINAVPKAPIPV